ncbi:MAG: hypothetical protein AAF081_03790 [Actinomycetota bacterium]
MQLTSRRTLRVARTDLERPHRHGSIAAVVTNLADEMAIELRDPLTAQGHEIETYGKGSISGTYDARWCCSAE